MKKIFVIIVWVFMVIAFPVFGVDESIGKTVKNIFLFNDNQLLDGLYGTSSYYFSIADQTKVLPKSYIELHFRHSPLQNDHDSSVSIFLNDNPLQSVPLSQSNEDDGSIRAYFKPQYLRAGFNKITFFTMQNISKHADPSRFSPANWFLIQKDSLLHLEMLPGSQPRMLSSYTELFAKNGNERADDYMIVLPDRATGKVINAALILAANIGQLYLGQTLEPKIVYYRNMTSEQKQHNLIFVGPFQRLIAQGLPNLKQKPQLKKGQIFLQRLDSPWNIRKKLLLVSGTDDAGVLKAARLLCIPELTKQLVTRDFRDFITEKQLTQAEDMDDREQFSLADLQMEDLRFKGIYTQKSAFSIVRPGGQRLIDGAYFEIHFTHSEAIDYDKSVMTVYLNGAPLRTIGLNSDNAENGVLRVNIPEEFYNTNVYNFSISFFLYLDNADSFSQFSESLWAEVKSSSFLFLPHQRTEVLDLSHFPDLFNDRGFVDDLLVVLPDNPGERELISTGTLLGIMSSGTKGSSNFEVAYASKISKSQQKKNIIAIGTVKSNSWIRRINKKLGIRFNPAWNRLVAPEKVVLLRPLAESSGLLELIVNPFHSGKKIFVITGVNQTSLHLALKALTDRDRWREFHGNAALVGLDGTLFTYKLTNIPDRLAREIEEGSSSGTGKANPAGESKSSLLFGAIMLFMIGISGAMVVYLLGRKKRAQSRN